MVQLGIPGEPTYSFFAVFDGHGGSFVSRTSAEQLLNRIMDTPEWKSGDRTPSRMAEGIRKGFLDMDEVLKRVRGDDVADATGADERCGLRRNSMLTTVWFPCYVCRLLR